MIRLNIINKLKDEIEYLKNKITKLNLKKIVNKPNFILGFAKH